jgi:starch synthase
VRLLSGSLSSHIPLYLVDAPGLFDRRGNPYVSPAGTDWPDNAQRFALFCRAIARVAMNRAELGWQPDLIHCNDWQTGLVPPLLAGEHNRPATLFTIHNLAYQGVFDHATFTKLQLPARLWSHDGLEFHNNLSFIKGGLAFADWLNTVSPTYAQEICTPAFGYGLEGLLRHREARLAGVLNGIDHRAWDPSADPHIHQHFDSGTFDLKAINKALLQKEMGLPQDEDAMLFGYVGRLVEQKGVDLILEILPHLAGREHIQLVMLGSGSHYFEQALQEAQRKYPQMVATHIGYDEPLAHRVEAGVDCFLMPSRFEPCGLNQLYSLRYGTVPIVHHTGGLADTVINTNPRTLLDGTATGFVFNQANADALWEAVDQAIQFFHRPKSWWHKLAINGMQQDYSWRTSANHYLELYHKAIAEPAPCPVEL